MSGFSFSDLANLGALANESLNAVVSPMYYGDVRRVFSGVALSEDGPSHNDFLLGPGEHQGFKLEKPLGSLRGEPGAIVSELAAFEATTKVDGLFFKQGQNNTSHLVVVESPAKVVFSNCIFQRNTDADSSPSVSTTLCFALIKSGAKAVFSNCIFQSTASSGVMSGAGFAIQDLNGAAGNVFVGLGANYSGHGHAATVTNLGGEIT
tara:strand:+ start:87 stop:707 length:621 start_codon:yes stop_codon:yes gene_type:complete